jgi:regulator of sirC expression with transglutaminase-like and TPR domain
MPFPLRLYSSVILMSSNSEKNQISHLIYLIDDRDDFVRKRVREQLIKLGEDTIPFLEVAARTENLKIKSIASEIIQAIVPKKLLRQFGQLAHSSPSGHWSLEKGVILLQKFGYPDEDTDSLSQSLDLLAKEVSALIENNQSPEQIIKIFTRYLFFEKGFEGNKIDFFEPDNTYFSRVLDRRKGIPITLSALCVLLGQRIGLPIVGVGLPGRYIAKYESLTQPIYFDPFNEGRILSQEDCASLTEKMGYRFEEHFLGAATSRETLIRMMNNLIVIYNKNSESEKASYLSDFIKALSGNLDKN